MKHGLVSEVWVPDFLSDFGGVVPPKWFIFVQITCRVVGGPPVFDKSITKWAARITVVLADILPLTLHLVTRDAVYHISIGAFSRGPQCLTCLAVVVGTLWVIKST